MIVSLNFAGSNKVALVKKARKYPTSEVVNERANNENPFFEISLSHTYANGYYFVSFLYKVSNNFSYTTWFRCRCDV